MNLCNGTVAFYLSELVSVKEELIDDGYIEDTGPDPPAISGT